MNKTNEPVKEIQFWLGSDPELMLRDKKSKQLKSAIPVITEGKGRGRALDSTGENCVLHDNVLVEFNTKPAANEDDFVNTIGTVLKTIDSIVSEQGLELWLQTSAEYPAQELESEEAVTFGCEPDFDAYLLNKNDIPFGAEKEPFRSAGGHLHIGLNEAAPALSALLSDPYGKITMVKAMDLLVGIPSIFLDKDPTAPARRKLYGRAGSHRPKEYGVEYRASGNWWLASPSHTRLVYMLSEAATALALDQKRMDNLTRALGGEEDVQDIINASKVEKARDAYEVHLKDFISDEAVELITRLTEEKSFDFRSFWELK